MLTIGNKAVLVAVFVCLSWAVLASEFNPHFAEHEAQTHKKPQPSLEGRNIEAVNTLQVSYEYSLNSTNNQGWLYSPMISGRNSACFLTYNEVWGDKTPVRGGCEVYYDSSTVYWYIYAFSGNTYSSSWCKSRCIIWS